MFSELFAFGDDDMLQLRKAMPWDNLLSLLKRQKSTSDREKYV